MAKKVHHYPAGRVAPHGGGVAFVPLGSRIVAPMMRRGSPVLYVEEPFPTPEEKVRLDVLVVGTGHAFDPLDLDFVGTLYDEEYGFFWHVYAKIRS